MRSILTVVLFSFFFVCSPSFAVGGTGHYFIHLAQEERAVREDPRVIESAKQYEQAVNQVKQERLASRSEANKQAQGIVVAAMLLLGLLFTAYFLMLKAARVYDSNN